MSGLQQFLEESPFSQKAIRLHHSRFLEVRTQVGVHAVLDLQVVVFSLDLLGCCVLVETKNSVQVHAFPAEK